MTRQEPESSRSATSVPDGDVEQSSRNDNDNNERDSGTNHIIDDTTTTADNNNNNRSTNDKEEGQGSEDPAVENDDPVDDSEMIRYNDTINDEAILRALEAEEEKRRRHPPPHPPQRVLNNDTSSSNPLGDEEGLTNDGVRRFMTKGRTQSARAGRQRPSMTRNFDARFWTTTTSPSTTSHVSMENRRMIEVVNDTVGGPLLLGSNDNRSSSGGGGDRRRGGNHRGGGDAASVAASSGPHHHRRSGRRASRSSTSSLSSGSAFASGGGSNSHASHGTLPSRALRELLERAAAMSGHHNSNSNSSNPNSAAGTSRSPMGEPSSIFNGAWARNRAAARALLGDDFFENDQDDDDTATPQQETAIPGYVPGETPPGASRPSMTSSSQQRSSAGAVSTSSTTIRSDNHDVSENDNATASNNSTSNDNNDDNNDDDDDDDDDDYESVVLEGVDVEELEKVEWVKTQRHTRLVTIWSLLIVSTLLATLVTLRAANRSLWHSAHPYRVSNTPPRTLAPTTAMPSVAPTFRPTTEHAVDLVNVLQVLSSSRDLATPGTPQHSALLWLLHKDVVELSQQEDANSTPTTTISRRPARDKRLLQRYILAVFYYATLGDQWHYCHSSKESRQQCRPPQDFLTPGLDECLWFKIDCTPDGFVSRMRFDRSTLQLLRGTLPSELGGLSELKWLSISEQAVGGTIPPELFWGARKLEIVALDRNQLQGPIPSTLRSHPSVEHLVLEQNPGLAGTFPQHLLDLPHLKRLELHSCQLQGTLPTEIGNLRKLENLQIGNNSLTGRIPTEMAQLQQLKEFNATGNQFTGEMPPILFQSWNHLFHLDLHQNFLRGHLPASVGWYWGKSSSARKRIDLSHNMFSGSIPLSLLEINRLKSLRLHANLFTGTLSVPDGVCPSEREAFFSLSTLTADCQRFPVAREKQSVVSCPCCTECY